MLTTHAFAIEIQHVLDFFLRSGLVDADVANIGHKSEVDDARLVLLVVLHKLIQAVVLLAVEGKHPVSWPLSQNIVKQLSLFRNIIDDAPKTNAFGDGSAPRTTDYIGWQIVRAYMKKSGCTMQQLFEETDSQKLLTQSGWRP